MKNPQANHPHSYSHANRELSPRFPVGAVLMTPSAQKAFVDTLTMPEDLIERHASGDWGEISEHDAHLNEFAVRAGLRILSSYPVPNNKVIWIITEADRSSTTLLLPEE